MSAGNRSITQKKTYKILVTLTFNFGTKHTFKGCHSSLHIYAKFTRSGSMS